MVEIGAPKAQTNTADVDDASGGPKMSSKVGQFKLSVDDANVADSLMRLFVNRTDMYAIQKEDGSYISDPSNLAPETPTSEEKTYG
ncbi:MAG: hypothetical protein V1915_03330 [Candidatus Bathyarchaeota archaeon]